MAAVGSATAGPDDATTLVGLDLRSGAETWRRDLVIGGSPPTGRGLPVAAGTLVVASASGVRGLKAATSDQPLLGADPHGTSVVVLDSPDVPYGMNDCC